MKARALILPRLSLKRLTGPLIMVTMAAVTAAWMATGGRLAAVGQALGTVSLGGFAAMVAFHLVLIAMLGSAWGMLTHGRPGCRKPYFMLGRLIRDLVAEALPLSQLGGYAIGARAVQLCGVAGIIAAASTMIDLAMELVAKLPYTVVGLALLAHLKPDNLSLLPALFAGLLMAATAALLVGLLIRGRSLLDKIIPRLAPRWTDTSGHISGRLLAAVDEIMAKRNLLASAVMIHASAWMLSAVEFWLPFHFMGSSLSIPQAIAIDSLVSGLRSFGFFVPGSIGVQEGAYVFACAMFNVPAGTALAASLLRRGRDIAIAVPALAAWQVMEGRKAWEDASVLTD